MRRLGRDQWMQLIAEYEADELSQKEFVAKHDVSLHTFQFHLYKTRKARLPSRNSDSQPAFLPVEVIASAAPKARGSEAAILEARLHSGLVVRFTVGADTRYLAELFAALG